MCSVISWRSVVNCQQASIRSCGSPGGLMAADGMRVHGRRDALETRPSETVPQRIGRPFPYGEALRRADMLHKSTLKHSGFHRALRGVTLSGT